MRKTIGDHALAVLREKPHGIVPLDAYNGIAWGDSYLLAEIADRAGIPEAEYEPTRWTKVLDALDRDPRFVKRYFMSDPYSFGGKKKVRVFYRKGRVPGEDPMTSILHSAHERIEFND